MKIDILLDVKTTLGEGPVWDVDQQRLYFIDSMDGRVFRCAPDGTDLRAWDVPGKIGSMALRKDGRGAIVSLDKGFWLLDFASGECELLHDPEPDLASTRLNDGKCDRAGRFFAGSMDMMEEGPKGSLYRVDPDLSVTRVEQGIICSNGPCFSPDDKTFYFTDTWSGEVWAYDYDIATGSLANRRCFAKVDTANGGAADGATVDGEGFYWMALVYDGRLCRFAPDGSLDREIQMPVKKVTSVQFGGPDMDVLYVTSMAKPPLPRFPGDGVLRGSLFAITGLGVTGVPEPRFGG
ncbi:SMP-30/gluconolactonase/LRE family protein [Paracoccus nototheniae]|uniref:SMP-30/gluconolactonase/LRE family protein n=1 Tax=Paracoccus nototheniae TaxID=2489002 RepID=UPI00103923AD|nr:SMP-30/gluconolactonase/LRE family protein [Paracoccus nototheniae]